MSTCEALNIMCWDLNSDPLEVAQVLLTTEQLLQSQRMAYSCLCILFSVSLARLASQHVRAKVKWGSATESRGLWVLLQRTP